MPKASTNRWRYLSLLGCAVLATPLILAGTSSALAGRKNKQPVNTELAPQEPAEPPEAAEPPPPTLTHVFDGGLPITIEKIPEGLANLSAQGCNACHYQAHDSWAADGHSLASTRSDIFSAAERAGIPACLNCHLPLTAQQPHVTIYQESDINHGESKANPIFDATLFGEGVTCAACHVREGRVITATPVTGSPHPTSHSPQLRTSELCASCHQLTWEGASQPLYDTYGEWKRSSYATAGIQCQDCHMRDGKLPHGVVSHSANADPARAISVLIDLSSVEITRGGDAIQIAVTLQNTGAGHSFPTGSPFKGVRLEIFLEGPLDSDGTPVRASSFQADLHRHIQSEPPWSVIEDTRIAPGQQKRWHSTLGLGFDKPGGSWSARVVVHRTLNGFTVGAPILSRTIPLHVH
jgi:hypothetical protein